MLQAGERSSSHHYKIKSLRRKSLGLFETDEYNGELECLRKQKPLKSILLRNLRLPRGPKRPLETWMRPMRNRKLAAAAITDGWSVGTATQCAVSIGNIRANHSSVVVAAWNTSRTTEFWGPQSEPFNRQGTNREIPNWCLVLWVRGSPFTVLCSPFIVRGGRNLDDSTSSRRTANREPRTVNGELLTPN
jgi:hypothetical protein